MMHEHNYISERLERRTYIKGKFTGQFTGYPDPGKSDYKYERFFDLEITKGEIFTSQNNLKKWQDGAFDEFTKATSFHKLPQKIKVSLEYIDHSVKYFQIELQELKLINCHLSKQVHCGNQVLGTIEGDVSGYILHYDTILKEIEEEEFTPPYPTPPTPPDSKGTTGYLPVLSIIFGLGLLVTLFVLFKNWLTVSLCLLFIALFFPYRRGWLVRHFNFRWTKKIITILSIILLSALVLMLVMRYRGKQKEELQLAAKVKALQRLDSVNTISNRLRKDSFDYYFNAGLALQKRYESELALKKLERASVFASPGEEVMLSQARIKISTQVAEKLLASKKYKQAIPVYTELALMDRSKSDFLFKRAVCYAGTGNIQAAVTDLKKAIALGNRQANALHNKINPVKKKVAYYVTRCLDGTTSNAKGRGACSHHGGVDKWDDPVYEESRMYQ